MFGHPFSEQLTAHPFSTGATAFVGAYDTYESSLAHVYEPARRVLTSYTGDLVCLRRDSDDAESDFGYDGDGNLDTAAIQSWLDADGASNAYVVTVYDQVNGDDVTQATKAAQPLYVASLQNGRPGMRLDGSDDYLQGAFTNGGALSQPFSVFAAAKLDAAVVNDDSDHYLFDSDDPSNRMRLIQQDSQNPDAWYIFSGYSLLGGDSDGNWNLWACLFDGADSEFWKNQVSEGSGGAGNENADGLTIGAYSGGLAHWDGDIAIPAIIADPALFAADRAALETAINAYWEIF
jgi:hypothetical protein